jgi:DNA invertase Pin-like site-specific DNA recombinase
MTSTLTRPLAKRTGKQPTRLAFSYIRFSGRSQEKGDSLRRQEDPVPGLCQRRGWTLSEKTYRDLGVSAFRGKNALVGNLGEFLKAVESGAVPEGSVLIVESLDRISRQGIDEGYDLIKRILKAGILLVTLAPEREFDVSATKSLSRGALEILIILERAAEESEMKSKRIAAAWSAKRKAAVEGRPQPGRLDSPVAGKDFLTHMLPAWIEERDGKLSLKAGPAKAIKRIFQLAASGYGRHRIARALTKDGFPPFGRSGHWSNASICFLLSDRRALGEYQPYKANGEPDGEPIARYYPPAVTEQEWLAARAGMSARRRTLKKAGVRWTKEEDEVVRKLPVSTAALKLGRSRAAVFQRRCKLGLTTTQNRSAEGNFINVFRGLIRHARKPFDTFMTVTRNDCTGPTKALLNTAHYEGRAPCYLFPLAPFEKAILGALRELDPRDVLPKEDKTKTDPVVELQTQITGVEAELATATAFMEAHGFSATIGKRITALEAQKSELAANLLDAKAQAACPAENAWQEYESLVDLLEKAPDPADARLRLRSALHRIVSEIRLLVVPRGRDKLAAVQVFFKGDARRDYLIWYRPTRSNGKATALGWWKCRSVTAAELAAVGLRLIDDLRDPDGVGMTVSYLKSLPTDLLERAVFGGYPTHPIP